MFYRLKFAALLSITSFFLFKKHMFTSSFTFFIALQYVKLSLLSASFLKKKLTISPWKCIKFDTRDFVWQFYTWKFIKIFLLKLAYKNSCVKCDAFQGEMVHFPHKNKTLKEKIIILLSKNNIYIFINTFYSIYGCIWPK